LRPGRTKHSQSLGSEEIRRVNKTSMRPGKELGAVGLCRLIGTPRMPSRRPYRRAGNTRVLLNTSKSSDRSNSGRSLNTRSAYSPEARFRCNMREASRFARGSCAMRWSGRWKLNSETSTMTNYKNKGSLGLPHSLFYLQFLACRKILGHFFAILFV
jgi:hypothetical protein